jgi:glucan endo-1,3-alpha-glucosidase
MEVSIMLHGLLGKRCSENDMYFVPDFDGSLGYNTIDPGLWAHWENVMDGLFTWESGWSKLG